MDVNNKKNSMRRFTFIFLFVVVAVTFILLFREKDVKTLPEKLEQAMEFTNMNTYQDSLWGYTVRYPEFFEQIPDSLIDEVGSCQFRFWNGVQIVQTVFVSPNQGSLTAKQGMDSLAIVLHATAKRCEGDTFILSGPLYVDNHEIPGHRFHAKYVGHRKLWFVQSLTYPEDCEKAVARLIKQIDNWNVWEENP